MKLLSTIALSTIIGSCNTNSPSNLSINKSRLEQIDSDTTLQQQIGNYVVNAFEDSKGNLWFATLEFGVARFDGTELKYFTTNNGLPSNRVVNIAEDIEGNLWFGTGSGLSSYDGKSFTNISISEDFGENMISALHISTTGEFWVGTWNGLFKFDGSSFEKFQLPLPEDLPPANEGTKQWITAILEDNKGNIWIARDGSGLYKFNGHELQTFLQKDGLLSNYVTDLVEDNKGNIWVSFRMGEPDSSYKSDITMSKTKGGLQNLQNGSIQTLVTIPELEGADMYEVYKDINGHIWACTTSKGIYTLNSGNSSHIPIPISVMSVLQDSNNNFWLAGAGGLYRLSKENKPINITQDGPW